MIVFLNSLFIFVSVMFFAGRLYEVLNLLEEGTYFLVRKGIVTTPLMIAIVVLISVCCGVLVFSDRKPQAKKLKVPVKLFGFLPAPFIIGASVLNIIGIFKTGGFLGYDIMMILAALGLVAYGVFDIKGNNREKLPMIMVMFMPFAMCMNAVILNVQPISDTAFLYYGLSAIFVLLFFLMLFQNAYAPNSFSRPLLYTISLLNFLFSGAVSLANLIGGFITDNLATADMLLYIALTVIGMYSLFVAFYITPSGEKLEPAPRKSRNKAKETEDYSDYEEDYVPEFIPYSAPSVKSEPSYNNPVFEQDTAFRQASKISEDTIAILFAQKEENQQKAVVDTAVKEITTEIAVTQIMEKYPQRNEADDSYNRTQVIKAADKPKEKSVFKSSGKKSTSNQKVVYKAPKK